MATTPAIHLVHVKLIYRRPIGCISIL